MGTTWAVSTKLWMLGTRAVQRGISWACTHLWPKRRDNVLPESGGTVFIAVDGIDGAGKTTLVSQLARLLDAFDPLVTKEPTDQSHWGQTLREAAQNGRLPRDKEIEYFHRDRLHHIDTVILPALQKGRAVITDRYVDSLLAFQTDSPEEASELYERMLPEILVPDITFILDCPVEKGLDRIARGRPAFSQYEKREVLERASRIYESRTGENYAHLNASGTIENTLRQAFNILVVRLRSKRLDRLSSELESGMRRRFEHLVNPLAP